MKITEITFDGTAPNNPLNRPSLVRLGRFSDGLNFIYGENNSGKSALRDFVRGLYFSGSAAQPNSSTDSAAYARTQPGHLQFKQGLDEFRVDRMDPNDHHGAFGNELRLSSITNNSSSLAPSVDRLLGNLTPELYDAVYSFSLRQTRENVNRLTHQLRSKLGVPVGITAAGDESAFLAWQRESDVRAERLVSLTARIDDLHQQRNRLQHEINTSETNHRARLAELDREIESVGKQIATFDIADRRHRLNLIETEMAELRRIIDNAATQVSYVAPVVSDAPAAIPAGIDPYAAQYQRLDEIDNQIRRWRSVQTDIQDQRMRLKDEMTIWEDMTLDSSEHPYHTAREILVALERKVDRAGQWADGQNPIATSRDETTSRHDAAADCLSLRDLCKSMRDDLYGLCQELSQQYKHIRHKSAAAELKQLRRCYHEIDENTQRLVRRRESVINEIRQLDPAGADAIVRAESGFCQCAMHEGYLEARRRMGGGPLAQLNWQSTQGVTPSVPITVPVAIPAPDLTNERLRLERLGREHAELVGWLNGAETELVNLKSRHAKLIRDRQSIRLELDLGALTAELTRIDTEARQQTIDHASLLIRVEEDRRFVRPTPNSILLRADELLRRLTSGELNQVWISDSSDAANGATLQVRNAVGEAVNFSALEPNFQDQVYLCLAVAAKEAIESRSALSADNAADIAEIAGNNTAPMLIDDAFANVPRSSVDATLQFYSDLSGVGHQIFLLTQHQYLADRLPGTPVFELQPMAPSIPQPEFQPARYEPVTTPLVAFATSAPYPRVETDYFDNNDAYHHPTANRANDRYPYSKYPPIEDVTEYLDRNQPTVSRSGSRSEPVRHDGHDNTIPYLPLNVQPLATGSGHATHSVSADQIGDPLGYAPTIDDRSTLGSIDLFSSEQLRALSDVDVEDVGQLLALDSDSLPRVLRDASISSDQINRWQAVCWLLSHVSGIRTNDAQILVACGVTEPEHLVTSHPEQLRERIERFLASSEGGRFRQHSGSISTDRIHGWFRALESTRSRWQNQSRFSRRSRSSSTDRSSDNYSNQAGQSQQAGQFGQQEYTQRQSLPIRNHQSQPSSSSERTERDTRSRDYREARESRPSRMQTPSTRNSAPAIAPAKSSQSGSKSSSNEKLRFYLDLDDHIEAAPSIGPKTAERFEKISVVTVDDFLKQTAESMATKLKYKRITAELVRQWQHQARLVCRIPNLRGHDAQLLVSCEFTEPEKVATMQPKQLLDVIGPFADTKEGLKIIRSGKKPDLAEITDWISWATQTRSLQAA